MRCFASAIIICWRHIPYSYKITFSGITPADRNQWGRNSTGRHRVTWHISLQIFGALCRTGAKWHQKMRFTYFFVSNTSIQCTVSSKRFLWNMNTINESVSSWRLLEQNFKIFSEKGSFSQKTVFLGVLRYTCSTCAAALAFRPTANLNIAPYSRRPGMFAPRVTFFGNLSFACQRLQCF